MGRKTKNLHTNGKITKESGRKTRRKEADASSRAAFGSKRDRLTETDRDRDKERGRETHTHTHARTHARTHTHTHSERKRDRERDCWLVA